MLHYKVFTSAAYGDDMSELEAAVNAWLDEAQPLVHTMTQSCAGESVIISFLYELDEDEDRRMSVATAEALVEASARRLTSPTIESVMVTLLPHAELPY